MIGYVDRIGMHAIVGWAERDPRSARPRTVQALFRGRVIGRATASTPRPDVGTVTRGNPNCGFVIEIDPPYDVDEIDVVADGTILPRAQQACENAASVHHKTARKAASLAEHMLRLTRPQSMPHDLEICERLIATYRALLLEPDRVFAGHKSMWSHLVSRNYRHLARMVAEGRPRELCDYLLHIHKRPETWGISQGPESYYLLHNALPGSAIHKAHATLYGRELLNLGEYLGIVPVENPDQGRVHDVVDLGAVVRALRVKTGIEPIFPHSAGGLFCVDTGEGLVQQRDIWALYSALRIADLLPDLSTRRICEIGGGLGQLCHYLRLLGASQYVLIDLPHVSLLQAFLLMRANPQSRIALFDGLSFDLAADICIYPTFMFQRAPDRQFDLTVNVDSMPEMGWDNALSYARTAARTSARFLSINQEARGPLGVGSARQINATEVLAEIPAFRQSYRFRSWVRRGYVESYFVAEDVRDALGASATGPADGSPRADIKNNVSSEPKAPSRSHASVRSSQTTCEGYLDTVGPEMIAGWARRTDNGKQPAEVDILIDGHFFRKTTADNFSAGLKAAGIGNGHHAFALRAPAALFDGKPHQVGACIAGTGVQLQQSPKDVCLPSIVELGPTISQFLTAEPWVIDAVSLKGSELELSGWAIPPRDGAHDAAFFVNEALFDRVEWPLPRHDIHELYFFHPHANRSGFTLKASLAKTIAGRATELVLRYGRLSTGMSISPVHDYYFPLADIDTFPLPQDFRRKRVSGTTDAHLFRLGGYSLLRKIDNLLVQRYATRIDRIGRILDWGCGCGRLLRFLLARVDKTGVVHGADIDSDNVKWCENNLPPATVSVVPLLPPSCFEPAQFNLILGNSVFTHLAEEAQLVWLQELHNILAPGGLAMVSVQTITDLTRETFHPAAYHRLLAQGFISEKLDNALAGVIRDDEYYRSAFHTHEYIRSVWPKYFAIDDIIPQFSNNMQDLVVMRKPT